MKQVTNKDVAIIILNWNAYDDTFECLKSLEHLTYPYFHVFLVDNASQDGSFDKLQQDYNDGKFHLSITFIQTGANLGFAGGNNVAIREAYKQGYQYFWLLNNDTVVDPNALTPLVETLEKDKQVGIVGSKIYYYGTNKIWFAGGAVSKLIGTVKHIDIGTEDHNNDILPKSVDYITGCSLLASKTAINKAGLMNESYFLYYEETDWNFRIRNQGFKIIYNPKSKVWHKVSRSTLKDNKFNPVIFYYSIRNNIFFIKEFLGSLTLIIFLSFTILRLIKNMLFNPNDFLQVIRFGFEGIRDGLKGRMGIYSVKRDDKNGCD